MIGITLLVWRCLLYIFVFKKVIVCSRKPFIVLHCRQCPRLSIRMIIWIFCSLVMMCISLVSTVTFPRVRRQCCLLHCCTQVLCYEVTGPWELWKDSSFAFQGCLYICGNQGFDLHLVQEKDVIQFGLTRPGDHDNDHVEQDKDFDDHIW